MTAAIVYSGARSTHAHRVIYIHDKYATVCGRRNDSFRKSETIAAEGPQHFYTARRSSAYLYEGTEEVLAGSRQAGSRQAGEQARGARLHKHLACPHSSPYTALSVCPSHERNTKTRNTQKYSMGTSPPTERLAVQSRTRTGTLLEATRFYGDLVRATTESYYHGRRVKT